MTGLVFEASMLVHWLSSEERERILKSLDFILSYFCTFFFFFFPVCTLIILLLLLLSE